MSDQERQTEVVDLTEARDQFDSLVDPVAAGRVRVVIQDHGRGFSPDGPDGRGFGLSGIAQRVSMLSGTLAIESNPGVGTTLTIVIPCGRR